MEIQDGAGIEPAVSFY